MAQALPEADWLPVPNLGDAVGDWVGRWELDGVILSGGEDRGENPRRDATEDALWGLCREGSLRLLGVCRGLQQLWYWHGGVLAPAPGHVAARHLVHWAPPWAGAVASAREVNSFHGQVLGGPLPAGLRAYAWGPAGDVEAAGDKQRRCAGLMWHPEREPQVDPQDRRFLRWFWLGEEPRP
jgi:putative glutamine amidotransferase